MATWAECRTEVKNHLWRQDLSDDLLDRHLTQAVKYICSKRDWEWLEGTKVSAATTASKIALPADYKAPIRLISVDASGFRRELKLRPLSILRTIWEATNDSGTPVDYAISDNQIFIGPTTLIDDYTYELHYRKFLATGEDNWLTENLDLLLIYRAASTLGARIKSESDAMLFGALFRDEMTAAEDEDDDKKSDIDGGCIEPDSDAEILSSMM